MGIDADSIFQAIKRIRTDNKRSLNVKAIQYGFQRGWINKWEHDFYLNTMRKRKLTEKQSSKRIQINEKFSENLKRSAK